MSNEGLPKTKIHLASGARKCRFLQMPTRVLQQGLSMNLDNCSIASNFWQQSPLTYLCSKPPYDLRRVPAPVHCKEIGEKAGQNNFGPSNTDRTVTVCWSFKDSLAASRTSVVIAQSYKHCSQRKPLEPIGVGSAGGSAGRR